ncbi:MAG TPA: hypothetical protein VFI25_16620 [Planctomycetota bacterium]|jgi:hypothetical protein|nr:hypothetical protein [Planctomycetota bacterium]
MERALEPILGPAFPSLLRASLRRRRLPAAFLRSGWAEEVRQAAALALLEEPSFPDDPGEARRRARWAIGRACWRLIERERRLSHRRIPIEEASDAPAREDGTLGEWEWEERVAGLSPEARALLETLLSAPSLSRRRGMPGLARAAGIPRRRLFPLIADLLSLAGGAFLEEAAVLLRARLAELEGGRPSLAERSRHRARRIARVLRHLPVGWGLREAAARVTRLERGAEGRRTGERRSRSRTVG